jgi:hypothetical protein
MVEATSSRTFLKSHLLQIASVLPQLYVIDHRRFSIEDPSWHLCVGTVAYANNADVSSELRTRQENFHNQLLTLVKNSHRQFLLVDKKISRDRLPNDFIEWHKDFPLESYPPDIEPLKIAKPNRNRNSDETVSSATVSRTRSLTPIDKILLGIDHPELAMQEKFNKALMDLDEGNMDNELVQSVISQPIPESLRGLPQSIVAQTRLRQLRQAERENVGWEKHLDRLRLLSHLPQIMDMIWSYFLQLGRTICPLQALETHLFKSHPKRLGEHDISEMVALLFEVAPKWCELKTIDSKPWFKMASKSDEVFSASRDVVENRYDEEKQIQIDEL